LSVIYLFINVSLLGSSYNRLKTLTNLRLRPKLYGSQSFPHQNRYFMRLSLIDPLYFLMVISTMSRWLCFSILTRMTF